MTAGSQFPDLDPDRASGFWKQHFSSNTLRRVSVSLQSDKITQKTFKGREHHTEEERAKQRGYKGRQNVHYERISSFDPSPSIKEARTLALATIWAFLPIPKLRGRPTWAPTIWRENPPTNTQRWWGYNGCSTPQGRPWGVHIWHPEEICRKSVGDVEDSFYPRIAGSEVTAVFRTFPATVLCGGREERRKKKRSRTGRVPHHSGTSTWSRGRHCSSRFSHMCLARSPFHSTRPLVVSQHWSTQAWRHRASPALEKLPCVHHRCRCSLTAFNSCCYPTCWLKELGWSFFLILRWYWLILPAATTVVSVTEVNIVAVFKYTPIINFISVTQ